MLKSELKTLKPFKNNLYRVICFRFLFKNNGVLFENEMIQIGVKSEFRQNLGRLGLFYGNKTQVPLVNFQTVLQWSAEDATKLNVQIKAVDSTLDAGAQIQQMITAECIDSYGGKNSFFYIRDWYSKLNSQTRHRYNWVSVSMERHKISSSNCHWRSTSSSSLQKWMANHSSPDGRISEGEIAALN